MITHPTMSFRAFLKITLIRRGPIDKGFAFYPTCAGLITTVGIDLSVLRPLEPTQATAVVTVPSVIKLVGTVCGETVFENL